MDTYLHIEPMHRVVNGPLSAGSTNFISFGERDLENDGYAGIVVGAPLTSIDSGAHCSQIPLMKSFEITNGSKRDDERVITETISFLTKDMSLLPVRTKIHTGSSEGNRICHTPSLNRVRELIVGMAFPVIPVNTEVVDILLNDDVQFQAMRDSQVAEWMRYDLMARLVRCPIGHVDFDGYATKKMVFEFANTACDIAGDMSIMQARELEGILNPESAAIPLRYADAHPIETRLALTNVGRISTGGDFKLADPLRIDHLPNIDRNPTAFRQILSLIDTLPLTDLNIDLVVGNDDDVLAVYANCVANRVRDYISGTSSAETAKLLMANLVNAPVVHEIMEKFATSHSSCSDDKIYHQISLRPIKLKIIKTIRDEILILLYAIDSTAKDLPICGVYYDIAIESLASMGLMFKPEVV